MAASKRARRIVKAGDFDVRRVSRELRQPRDGRGTVNSWSLEQIFAAREAQMRGHFALPARMAEQMRTDDALAVAYENRLAPQRCVETEILPARGARGAAIGREAEALFGPEGVAIHPDTRADIHGCLVNHGVAFAQVIAQPREDGSRVDFEVRYWPIEYVRWDSFRRSFLTRVDPTSSEDSDNTVSGEVEICHGDGRWIIFQKHETDPFRQEAALLPAALVWARHAHACRDWAKGSVSHGGAKVVGELPVGVPLQASDGSLTPEASAFADLLVSIASDDAPVGIRPAGSKTEFLTNSSTAWQVWQQLVDNAEKAAARIYLGTDGTLGANGGAPGVDITALFGVALTKVRGDLECISRGITTGVIEPWCAINFGDSSLSPKHSYRLPDSDALALADETSRRNKSFFDDVSQARTNGFQVDQPWIDDLAKKYGITPPMLPIERTKSPSIALAPTDIARVVSVNEARASAGLGPLTLADGSQDPDGLLTVEAFAAKANQPAPVAPVSPAVAAMTAQKHQAEMTQALLSDLLEAKALGLTFTRDKLESLARRYGVPCPESIDNVIPIFGFGSERTS